jgi:hypothetical protein
MIDAARTLFPIAARDLIAGLAARENFESTLEHLARRRGPAYAQPDSANATDDAYWTTIAVALAPEAPPEYMPMRGLIEFGLTLEGGAKGLRGLFKKEPSEKERRKVLKIATLAARVMEIVSNANHALERDEQRLIAMAMASFGLSNDEITQTRASGPVSFENLEIFGDLDARTRRELVRGAWQLALVDNLDPQKDLVVRGVAARLEMSAEADQVRSEVLAQVTRQSETATVAIELARGPSRSLPSTRTVPWIEHLITAAAPPARRAELTSAAQSTAPVLGESLPKLDASRRKQACALAMATLLGSDPPVSVAMHLRAEARAAAIAAGIASDFEDGLEVVDHWLFDRIRDTAAAPPPAAVVAPREQPPGPPNATSSETDKAP